MKGIFFVCRYGEPLRSYLLPIDGRSAKFDVFPCQLFRGGLNFFSEVGFKAWPHMKLVCKFFGNPLRDGWDPLSRNLGPKPTDRPIKKKGSAQKQIAVHGYARQAAKLFTLSITASENARHASTTISMNTHNVVDLAGASAALARGRLQLPYRYINIHHCLQDTTMNNHQCQWAGLISIHHRHQRGWIMMSLSSSSLPTVTQCNAVTRCYDHRLPY